MDEFEREQTVRRLMALATDFAAAWARDEMIENPRVFKAPSAGESLREALREALRCPTS